MRDQKTSQTAESANAHSVQRLVRRTRSLPMWLATLHTDGWAGHRTFRCQVIGETNARYLITTDGEEIQLPRSRMYPGQTAYVPKTAVTRRLPNGEAHRPAGK